jgi:Cof subfamily protein (haloacid dehalogenase superfamily)
MYKMIALDLDGTLNNDQREITPRTRDALLAVQEMGVTVVLASGRQAPGLLPDSEALQLEKHHGLLLSYGGGRITDATTGEVVFDSSIDNETAVRFLRHLEAWPELSPIVDDGHDIYTTDASRHKVYDESHNNQLGVKIVPNIADAVTWRPCKILTAAPNEILMPHLDDISRGFTDKMSFVQSAPLFYEGMPKGTSKEGSLAKVCAQLGIEPAEVMAFGDAQNDMGMVRFAGHGVAMGNACPELKAMADEVTLTNNEDGIAHTLERIFKL